MIKSGIFLFLFAMLISAACNKDKFETIPTIRFKSFNTHVVPVNGSLIVTLECTDKEGDVQDSLIVLKVRQNERVVATLRDELRYTFPGFPSKPRTEITSTLDYISLQSAVSPPTIPGSNPPQLEPDTLILRFVVRDNAGNTSDTLNSDRVIVFR